MSFIEHHIGTLLNTILHRKSYWNPRTRTKTPLTESMVDQDSHTNWVCWFTIYVYLPCGPPNKRKILKQGKPSNTENINYQTSIEYDNPPPWIRGQWLDKKLRFYLCDCWACIWKAEKGIKRTASCFWSAIGHIIQTMRSLWSRPKKVLYLLSNNSVYTSHIHKKVIRMYMLASSIKYLL